MTKRESPLRHLPLEARRWLMEVENYFPGIIANGVIVRTPASSTLAQDEEGNLTSATSQNP